MADSKLKAGRSRDYVDSLKSAVTNFADWCPVQTIDEIGLPEVEKYLDTKTSASRSTIRARLSTLFKFAIRRGYRLDNPCARLEPIKFTRPPPQIFTVAQVRRAMAWLNKHPRILPWFVLSTFCGLRPEEAEKTTRADIHLVEGWIRVEAQTTKVRQRRVVYPKREAMAMLKVAMKKGKLPIRSQPRRRALRRLRKLLGFTAWPKDITRHTAASYWLADCESAASVAKSLGNSESVLMRHYAALVTREQAREFWAIRA
jgi:integrase